MNLQLLEYAVEVEKTGSITKAAENLYMNQPHLSRSIKDLEKEMGIQIFSRTSRGIVPTEVGEEFLKYARDVLAKVEDLKKLHEKSEQEKQSLWFVSVRGGYIREAFVRFAADVRGQRDFQCYFKEADTKEILDLITEKKYRLGIVRFPLVYESYYKKIFREKDLSVQEILRMQYRVRMAEDHALAEQEELTYLELADCVEIVYEDERTPVFGFRKTKDSAEQKIHVSDRDSAYELLWRIPSAYLWEAPEADGSIGWPGLIQKDCSKPGNDYVDVAVWRKGYKQTEAEKQLLKLILEEAGRMKTEKRAPVGG
ncbi:MAG: LysR family transcriptional regulator [Brotaphodocola sp.]